MDFSLFVPQHTGLVKPAEHESLPLSFLLGLAEQELALSQGGLPALRTEPHSTLRGPRKVNTTLPIS